MELFWYVLIQICWALGTILLLWDVSHNKKVLKHVKDSGIPDIPILMIIFCLLCLFLCMLWPIWTSIVIVKKIRKEIKER